jgi:hypothetical protein
MEVLCAADPKAPVLFEDFEFEHDVPHVRLGSRWGLNKFPAGGAKLGVMGNRLFGFQRIRSPEPIGTRLFAGATPSPRWRISRRGRRGILRFATLLRPALTVVLGLRIAVFGGLGIRFVLGLARPFEGAVGRRGPGTVARVLLHSFEVLDGTLPEAPGGVEQPALIEGSEVIAIHLGEIIFRERWHSERIVRPLISDVPCFLYPAQKKLGGE